ncbi:hypothetical protein WKH57_01395 [Niallia taxi]|uniref:hypothetical protein n=1 Tax=Niallia taxi TaxID=2499688 RepID=UPI00316FC90F
MTFIMLFIAGVLELQGACYTILNKVGKIIHKNLTMKDYWLSALLIGVSLDITYFTYFIFSR